jgi:hypothetical protein
MLAMLEFAHAACRKIVALKIIAEAGKSSAVPNRKRPRAHDRSASWLDRL